MRNCLHDYPIKRLIHNLKQLKEGDCYSVFLTRFSPRQSFPPVWPHCLLTHKPNWTSSFFFFFNPGHRYSKRDLKRCWVWSVLILWLRTVLPLQIQLSHCIHSCFTTSLISSYTMVPFWFKSICKNLFHPSLSLSHDHWWLQCYCHAPDTSKAFCDLRVNIVIMRHRWKWATTKIYFYNSIIKSINCLKQWWQYATTAFGQHWGDMLPLIHQQQCRRPVIADVLIADIDLENEYLSLCALNILLFLGQQDATERINGSLWLL